MEPKQENRAVADRDRGAGSRSSEWSCGRYRCAVSDLAPILTSDGRPLPLADIESAALQALARNLLDAEATLRILQAARRSLEEQTS